MVRFDFQLEWKKAPPFLTLSLFMVKEALEYQSRKKVPAFQMKPGNWLQSILCMGKIFHRMFYRMENRWHRTATFLLRWLRGRERGAHCPWKRLLVSMSRKSSSFWWLISPMEALQTPLNIRCEFQLRVAVLQLKRRVCFFIIGNNAIFYGNSSKCIQIAAQNITEQKGGTAWKGGPRERWA